MGWIRFAPGCVKNGRIILLHSNYFWQGEKSEAFVEMKISRRKPRCVDGNVPLGRCGSCSAFVCQEQKKTEKENPICFTQVANYRYYSITPHTATTAAKKIPTGKHIVTTFAFIFLILLSGSLNSELWNFLFLRWMPKNHSKIANFCWPFWEWIWSPSDQQLVRGANQICT